jgi:NADH:ubiquinone oxidoreductase subunit F (NADH-binding)
MMADPHALIEGCVITSYAIRANFCAIYIRGEALHCIRRVRHAVNEAYATGYLGKDILGSGFNLDVLVHAGAGAYICGEETALLDSLEGRRGQPRLKPPFPATSGFYRAPTVVNNVETIATVPDIVRGGSEPPLRSAAQPLMTGQVRVRRVYDSPDDGDSAPVLIDRIWSRGITRTRAQLREWCRADAMPEGCAPSSPEVVV